MEGWHGLHFAELYEEQGSKNTPTHSTLNKTTDVASHFARLQLRSILTIKEMSEHQTKCLLPIQGVVAHIFQHPKEIIQKLISAMSKRQDKQA